MGSIAPEIGEQSTAEKLRTPLLQAELFEPTRPTLRQFLRRLLRNHLKEAACLVFPESDPDRALINFCAMLDDHGDRKRHLDVEYLRRFYALGPDFREAIVRYFAEDNGFDVIRRPDPVRAEARIAALERSAAELAEAAEAIVRELAAMRGGK